MLEVSNLQYAYDDHQEIMQFPDFTLDQSESVLLMGQSGSGKSTLISLISGILDNQDGSIKVLKHDITQFSRNDLDRFRGKEMGVVFQNAHLMQALNVEENIKLTSYLSGAQIDTAYLDHLMHTLGLKHLKKSRPAQLSRGEVQRVAVARALIHKPALLLADEPTANLDDEHCASVVKALLELTVECKSTLLIATHDHRLREHINSELRL